MRGADVRLVDGAAGGPADAAGVGVWLGIVGVNEDGALSPRAAALVGAAGLVVGGARHLALAGPLIAGRAERWASPIEATVPLLLGRRGQATVVLASGDPMWFGVGSLLLRHVPVAETQIVPVPSSFSLAAAVLGWSLQDVTCLSCCGRPVAAIVPHLQPGARLLVLSAGAETPGAVAALVRARGIAASILVLESLGGAAARVCPLDEAGALGALNLLAITVQGPAGATLPLTPGLGMAWFEHDGQITRPEVRAMTLAALAPRQGELLWDVGCGAGSVAIEWMLRHPANRAVGLERRADRAARARGNAVRLGVPGLDVREGSAPAGLHGLPPPDAVFLGGGAHQAGVIDGAWAALRPGGRLVANAVTIETEAALVSAQARFGGDLTRIGIERMDRVGGMAAYRPAMTVTQWAVVK